jgi:dynein assembly factor 5
MEDLQQKLQRDLNCLSDPNRGTRKRALEKLTKTLTGASLPAGVTAETLATYFSENLQAPLLTLLADPVEKNRELACELISRFAKSVLPDVTPLVREAVPILKSRLGEKMIVEPAEEIRLVMFQLLNLLLSKEHCWAALPDLMEDISAIVSKLSTDPFPDIKRECCTCIGTITKAAPAAVRLHTHEMAKALVENLGHQHSKVRSTVVQALGVLVPCCGADGIDKMFKDILQPIAKVVHDRTPTVRKELVKMTLVWLRGIENVAQFEAKLLPMLFFGLSDETEEIQNFTFQSIDEWGNEWAASHPDEMAQGSTVFDFDGREVQLEKPFTQRPCVGSRVAVRRILHDFLPPLLSETANWTAQTRRMSACVLHSAFVYAEDGLTAHLEDVLKALASSCRDDEEAVCENIFQCAKLLGYYIDTDVLLNIVLPQVRGEVAGGDTPAHRTAALILLSAGLQGMSQERLVPHLQDVAKSLWHHGLREAEELELQEQVLNATIDCIETAGESCSQESIGLNLFWVLMQLLASPHAVDGSDLQTLAFSGLDRLAEFSNLPSVEALHIKFFPQVFAKLLPSEGGAEGEDEATPFPWKTTQASFRVFNTMLKHGGQAAAANMDKIIPVIILHLNVSNEPELRLSFLAVLETSLGDAAVNKSYVPFGAQLLLEGIMPNTIWRSGRVAATIRKLAIACLYTLLKEHLADRACLFKTAAQILPVLKGALDDTDANTRHLCCLCFRDLFQDLPGALSDEPIRQLYPELLKRLDDSNDTVRRSVCLTYAAFLKAAPARLFQGTVLDYSMDCFFVHLDDSDELIQAAVFEVIKEAIQIDKETILKKAQEVRGRHRNPAYCDKLLSLCAEGPGAN